MKSWPKEQRVYKLPDVPDRRVRDREKFEAGIQPLTVSQAPTSQYAQGWNDCLKEARSQMTNGDFHCPACGSVMKGPTSCGSCLWERDTCGYALAASPSGEDAADSPASQIATITKDLIETLMLWNGHASAGLDVSGLAGLRDELVELAARAKDSK